MTYSKIGILISIGTIALLLLLSFFSLKPKFIFPIHQLTPWKYRGNKIAQGLIVFCIVIMPLQLGFVSQKSIVANKSLPVQIVLDVSLSMSAYDISPSRFSAAKASLLELIRGLEGYDVSLITFSGIPFVAVPFSHDIPAVLTNVEKISLSDFPAVKEFLGTALGDALLLGLGNLQKRPSGSSSPGILLLITDGESNEGYDPSQVVALLHKKKIPVFALGIGNSDYLIGYDKWQQPIATSINIPLLQNIALQTSGAFSRGLNAQDIDQFLQSLLMKIKAQEPHTLQYTYRYLNKYLLILLLISLGGLFSLRMVSRRGMMKKH